MSFVHDLFLICTLVLQMQAGQQVGTATGFFYERAGAVYLVTNRHVVRDERIQLRPDALRISVHTDASDVRQVAQLEIPLYRNGKARWHVHPQKRRQTPDIAVIELDQEQIRAYPAVKALSSRHFLPEGSAVSPGQDLMVVGYPRALQDAVHHLPIVRNATVSSAYGIPFGGAPLFLVDARLHPGMSGSPVLTKPADVVSSATSVGDGFADQGIYFLGIHSAGITAEIAKGSEPLGLGTVWYARLIEEILDGFAAD